MNVVFCHGLEWGARPCGRVWHGSGAPPNHLNINLNFKHKTNFPKTKAKNIIRHYHDFKRFFNYWKMGNRSSFRKCDRKNGLNYETMQTGRRVSQRLFCQISDFSKLSHVQPIQRYVKIIQKDNLM